jgi:hypothetical protein
MAWRERNRAELEEKKFCNKLFLYRKEHNSWKGQGEKFQKGKEQKRRKGR